MGILYQIQAGVDIACCFRAWITGAIGAMGGNIMISGIRHRLIRRGRDGCTHFWETCDYGARDD